MRGSQANLTRFGQQHRSGPPVWSLPVPPARHAVVAVVLAHEDFGHPHELAPQRVPQQPGMVRLVFSSQMPAHAPGRPRGGSLARRAVAFPPCPSRLGVAAPGAHCTGAWPLPLTPQHAAQAAAKPPIELFEGRERESGDVESATNLLRNCDRGRYWSVWRVPGEGRTVGVLELLMEGPWGRATVGSWRWLKRSAPKLGPWRSWSPWRRVASGAPTDTSGPARLQALQDAMVPGRFVVCGRRGTRGDQLESQGI